MMKLKQDLIDLGKKVLNPNGLELIGIDLAKGEDKTVCVTLQNGSVIERTISYETCAMSCRSRLFLDKAYDKYLKRVKNRQKLYEKLRKLGR